MELQVVLRQFDSRDEAELAGNVLRASGIPAFVAPFEAGSVDVATGRLAGANLFVDVEDFTEAEHLVPDPAIDEPA